MNIDASEHIIALVKQARIAKYLMQDIMEDFFECWDGSNMNEMRVLMLAEYNRTGAKAEAVSDAIFEIGKAAKALEAMYDQMQASK